MKMYEFVSLLLVAAVIGSASVMAAPARIYVDSSLYMSDGGRYWSAKDLTTALDGAGLEHANIKAIRVRDLPPGGWDQTTTVTVWPGGYVEVRAEGMTVQEFVQELYPVMQALGDDAHYATAYPRRR